MSWALTAVALATLAVLASAAVAAVGWVQRREKSQLAEAAGVLHQTRNQLTQQVLALQVTLDSMSQGVVSIDANGCVVARNQRVLEMLDLPPSLLAPGARLEETIRFQTARGDFDSGRQPMDPERRGLPPLEGNTSLFDHYVRRTRDGSFIEIRTVLLPDGGRVRMYSDVSAYLRTQQALREREIELRTTLDGFPGMLVAIDSKLEYTYANEHVLQWLGRSRAALIGRSIREHLSPARVAEIVEFMTHAKTGEQTTVESHYQATATRPATSLQVTQVMGPPDASGGRKCYAFGLDITARKRAEEATIAAKEEAERANRAKSAFLARMSHELRTPLNAIMGFGQLLASDPSPTLGEEHRARAREIVRASRHLLVLINEVLDLSLVERGKLQVSLEPVLLQQLIHECLALLRPLASKEGIALEFMDGLRADCHVLADRTRLRQVLLNLVSNGIKYNQIPGSLRLSCAAAGDQVWVDVIDNGPGLSEQQQARLFEPFERLDAQHTAIEGAGLGLALSHAFMQAMGGSIRVQSELGVGSTFSICLSAADAPGVDPGRSAADALAAAPPDQAAAMPRKILYIEDNPINVLVMEAMLERMPTGGEPIQVLIAPLPSIGLQMAVDASPDLILLDLRLPEMDGFEVLRRLRGNEACRGIPVIAVSASAMPADVEGALAAGFDQYLSKPVEMAELHAALVRQAARGSGSGDAAAAT